MILDPRQPPVLVYCRRCDLPVERIQYDHDANWWRLGIHTQCCGNTTSVRLTSNDVLQLKASGEKYYAGSGRTAAQFKARARGR